MQNKTTLEGFECVRTKGSYTVAKIRHYINCFGFGREQKETVEHEFDTLRGDQENLTGTWEKFFEGSFTLLGQYLYTSRDGYGIPISVAHLAMLDAVNVSSTYSTGCIVYKLDPTILDPRVHISFIRNNLRENNGHKVVVIFKNQGQFAKYTSTLDSDTVMIAKMASHQNNDI